MRLRRTAHFLIYPLAGYVACYFVLTFPLILRFNSHYFAGDEDGLQMIWNIWWVRHALLDLHQSFYFTTLLHAPAGASLWLDCLTPFNGLLGVPLSLCLSSIQVYNSLIVLAFAGSGLTAFWLCHDQTRRYWPSLAGGYAFAFSSFHFAHAPGHLHQISTECFPLYLLLLLKFVRRPTVSLAIGASVTLLLVLLSDHYQFAYAGLLTVLIACMDLKRVVRQRRGFATFAALSLLLCGPLLWPMWRDSGQAMWGHPAVWFSAQLEDLLIPGVSWQYADLTRPVWQRVGQYEEKDIAVSLATLAAAMMACSRGRFSRGHWWMIAAIFTAFALGPVLHFFSFELTSWMPYRLLELLPVFKYSGCPGRMMMVTQLALSVLAAAGLGRFGSMRAILASRWRTVAACVFTVALVVQSQPRLQESYAPQAPNWVYVLRDSPIDGAVVDLRDAGDPVQLYYQTIHHRPMSFGYLARVTDPLKQIDSQVRQCVLDGRYDELARAGFGCIVLSPLSPPAALPLLYEDKQVRISRLPSKTDLSSHDQQRRE